MSDMFGKLTCMFPILRMSPDEIDRLALLAARGDREAEDRVIRAVTPIILKVASRIPSLLWEGMQRHYETVRAEGFLSTVRAIRRYDGRRGRFTAYLKPCLWGDMRRQARQLMSPIGAHARDNAVLDLEQPTFTRCVTEEVAARQVTVEHAISQARRSAAARHALMKRLQRLSPFEREILLRRWGIPVMRASRNEYARQAAINVRAESLREIAADYELSSEMIRRLQMRAMARINLDTKPGAASRKLAGG